MDCATWAQSLVLFAKLSLYKLTVIYCKDIWVISILSSSKARCQTIPLTTYKQLKSSRKKIRFGPDQTEQRLWQIMTFLTHYH